jgi:hypothetical protein
MRIGGGQLGQALTLVDALGTMQFSSTAAAATVVQRVFALPGGFLREPAAIHLAINLSRSLL